MIIHNNNNKQMDTVLVEQIVQSILLVSTLARKSLLAVLTTGEKISLIANLCYE